MGACTSSEANMRRDSMPHATGARTWNAESPPDRRVQVLELYTSQGCWSCPAADRWMLKLFETNDHPSSESPIEDWFNYVLPVAFHVNYWDNKGWADPFAKEEYTQRQRFVATRAQAATYTPGVFLQGQEFTSWRRTRAVAELQDSSVTNIVNAPAVGKLTIAGHLDSLEGTPETKFTFQFNAGAPEDNAIEIHAVCCSGAELTRVKWGENIFKKLKEGFIVRSAIHKTPMTKVSDSCQNTGSVWEHTSKHLKPTAECQFVMAWVVAVDGCRYLQAAGTRIVEEENGSDGAANAAEEQAKQETDAEVPPTTEPADEDYGTDDQVCIPKHLNANSGTDTEAPTCGASKPGGEDYSTDDQVCVPKHLDAKRETDAEVPA